MCIGMHVTACHVQTHPPAAFPSFAHRRTIRHTRACMLTRSHTHALPIFSQGLYEMNFVRPSKIQAASLPKVPSAAS